MTHSRSCEASPFKAENVSLQRKPPASSGDSHNNNNASLELTMTGAERRNYAEWKAERDRIDAERMRRAQASNGGEWRREWDSEKSG